MWLTGTVATYGVVRSIRTGFSGPGTGQYYEEEKALFNRTIDTLLKE